VIGTAAKKFGRRVAGTAKKRAGHGRKKKQGKGKRKKFATCFLEVGKKYKVARLLNISRKREKSVERALKEKGTKDGPRN
jgi:hypothetical protein